MSLWARDNIIATKRLEIARLRALPEFTTMASADAEEAARHMIKNMDLLRMAWRSPLWPKIKGPKLAASCCWFTDEQVEQMTNFENSQQIIVVRDSTKNFIIAGAAEAVREIASGLKMFGDEDGHVKTPLVPVPDIEPSVQWFPPAPDYQPGMAPLYFAADTYRYIIKSGFMTWADPAWTDARSTDEEETEFLDGRTWLLSDEAWQQFRATNAWFSKQKRLKHVNPSAPKSGEWNGALAKMLGLPTIEPGIMLLAALSNNFHVHREMGDRDGPIGISSRLIKEIKKQFD